MVSSAAAVALVFGLLGAWLWWVRRFRGASAGGRRVGVVATVSLSASPSVTVVRGGGRYFLLGATAHSITLIAELPSESFADPESGAGLAVLPELAGRLRSLRMGR